MNTLERRPKTERFEAMDSAEVARQLRMRESIRRECREKLVACAHNEFTAYNLKDVDDYFQMGLTEERLAFLDSEEDKTEELQRYLKDYIPQQVEQAKQAGDKVRSLLKSARAENAISLESMTEWLDRMKSGNWLTTRSFIEEKLPGYVAAWKDVAQKRRDLLKDPRMKELKESKLLSSHELNEFLSGKDFLNAHYNRRVHLVGLVKAALRGLKSGPKVEGLLEEARRQLDDAADRGILAKNKVGVWMKRISKFKNDPTMIENFLNGKGSDPLSKLKANWTKVRGRFDKIEERRAKEGTPQQFNFVKLDVFLYWDFDKRETYVEQAEQRFESYKNDPDSFLKIRHALDASDWDEADDLLNDAYADQGSLSDSHRRTLASLRRYYEAHAPKQAEVKVAVKEHEGPNPESIVNDMRLALDQIPYSSVRKRWAVALKTKDSKAVWALKVLYYNWKWCRVHGYSSDEQDSEMRKGAKERTYEAIEDRREGKEKDRGHVDYDLTTDTSVEMVREDADTRSAQAWHVDESTNDGELLEKIDRIKNTRAVWYWTRIMEKNIPYSGMEHLIDNVFPVLTRGARKLEEMGVKFTESGPLQYKGSSVVRTQQETHSKAKEATHALAA